jgi:phage shock protein PspC (stress-responsive transcriptional regulator)
MLAGVCGGLAEQFGSDPALLRLLAAILAILTGIFPLLILYLIAAVIIPEGDPVPAGMPAAEGWPGTGTGAGAGAFAVIIGGILVLVGLSAFIQQFIQVDWDLLWPIGLMAIGIAVIALAFQRQPNR